MCGLFSAAGRVTNMSFALTFSEAYRRSCAALHHSLKAMAPAMAQGAVYPRTSKSRCNESFATHFRKASAKGTS